MNAVVPVSPKNKLDTLSRKLGYEFSDQQLLVIALSHRSVQGRNNERLEFLGDSILNFSSANYLYERFPHAKEGELSRLRASLVKGETLAGIARELKLGDFLNLGEGELKSGGYRRDSILADAVEAIIGAIYLDSGMEAANRCILRWFEERLSSLSLDSSYKDPKTKLQEWLQARKFDLPVYSIVETEGDAHCQTFTVHCAIELLSEPIVAEGSSRRKAEKLAAEKALHQLERQARG